MSDPNTPPTTPPPPPSGGGGTDPGVLSKAWSRFRGWPVWGQVLAGLAVVVIVISAIGGGADDDTDVAADTTTTAAAADDEAADDASGDDTDDAEVTTTTEAPTTTTTTTAPPPEPVVVSGTGDDTPSFAVDFPAVVEMTHSGGSNFAVVTYAGSERVDLLANTVGSYTGTKIVEDWDLVDSAEITADGPWELRFVPIETLPVADLAAGAAGTGDAVIRIPPGTGPVTVTHDGTSNFAIVGFSDTVGREGLMVNEIGAYDGTVRAEGTVLDITADGNWTITER